MEMASGNGPMASGNGPMAGSPREEDVDSTARMFHELEVVLGKPAAWQSNWLAIIYLLIN